MSGINDNVPLMNTDETVENDDKEPILDKLKRLWNNFPFWLRILIACALIAVVLIIIVVLIVVLFKRNKKEQFGTKIKKPNSKQAKETFVTLNDIDVNSYVNSYIASTRGDMI